MPDQEKALVANQDFLKELQSLKNQIMPGASDTDIRLFAKFCAKTKLDPFSRQIYAISRGGKWTYQTSIDGFRVIAERSGEYEGQTPVFWCGNDGAWVDVWLKNEPPKAAKVGVYKRGHKEPTWAVAKFSSYAQAFKGKLSGLWGKMPEVMIAKCAESLALRKAFPNDLSGIYTTEEMGQAENVIEQKNQQPAIPAISDEMVKDLLALHKESGAPENALRVVFEKWGIETIKELKIDQYQALKSRFLVLLESKKEKEEIIEENKPKPRSAKEHTFKVEVDDPPF